MNVPGQGIRNSELELKPCFFCSRALTSTRWPLYSNLTWKFWSCSYQNELHRSRLSKVTCRASPTNRETDTQTDATEGEGVTGICGTGKWLTTKNWSGKCGTGKWRTTSQRWNLQDGICHRWSLSVKFQPAISSPVSATPLPRGW